MASLHLLRPFPSFSRHKLTRESPSSASDQPNPHRNFKSFAPFLRASINGDNIEAVEPKQPSKRGRKKGSTNKSPPSSSSSAPKKKPGRPRKIQTRPEKVEEEEEEQEQRDPEPVSDSELEDYDDGMEGIAYMEPPLICCFGAAQKEFVPSVRVHDNQMHPDIYSTWKMLQWDPPEFVRAPGGPPSNVAISHVRLGGRAEFMGKVGDDEFGEEMVLLMNMEKVQTRGVKFDPERRTAVAKVRFRFEEGRMRADVVEEAAEDSLRRSELNLAVLKEARIFHFTSEVLTSPRMSKTLFKAIAYSKKFGGLVFFDPNLSLPLWRSRNEAREFIKRAWNEANFIEVTRQELEFLLDEEYYERKRNYVPQYFSENYEQTKQRRDCYHYTREDIAPLWHDGLKFLFVTDGTLRIHFYTPTFDGVVVGTEDVLITPFTCDRTGSGDAIVAAIIRKLTTCPEMYEDLDVTERQLRFAVAAGIIAQWTIGGVRGFPTESASQNLKEQVYVPSMW